MIYTIKNEQLTVKVNDFGAELTSITFNGKEKLWQNENGEWNGHAPILFPVCGHCEMIVNNINYYIPFHGFALTSEFSLTNKTENSLTFSLKYSEKTLKVYPFEFELVVCYKIENNKLCIEQEIFNLSNDNPMFASIGGHESYALDCDLDNYYLEFQNKEIFLNNVDDNGYLFGKYEMLGNSNALKLKKEYFADNKTLILSGIKSRYLSLKTLKGDCVCNIFKGEATNLLLWHPKDAEKVVCIEPWFTLPDCLGESKQFNEKENVIYINPKSSKKISRYIEYL